VLLLAVLTACGSGDDSGATAAEPASTTTAAPTTTAPDAAEGPAPRPLPPAPALPQAAASGPEPTGLTIDSLDVRDAPVLPVGVEDDGEMEIPAVDGVGWYRFGARPGGSGSTVLAAHIAYDGVDGVFRNLDDLDAGATVQVALADGTTADYVVTDVTQVPKTALPTEVWDRDGEPRLVLITCGGVFDEAARSYEDNVVAWARPA
jgi:LPXTG-site transpeptidase (sortase) family protein